jgi:hypothetical protein
VNHIWINPKRSEGRRFRSQSRCKPQISEHNRFALCLLFPSVTAQSMTIEARLIDPPIHGLVAKLNSFSCSDPKFKSHSSTEALDAMLTA